MNGDPSLLPIVVSLVTIGVWGYAVLDFSRTDEADMLRFSRPVWIAILVLGSVVGAVLWLATGRASRR